MSRNDEIPYQRRVLDHSAAATEQMKHYCATHPESPSAARRPQLFFRGDLWIAVLGPSVDEGIVGIGPTVAAALRAFDAQYLIRSHSPNEEVSAPMKPERSLSERRPPDAEKSSAQ